MFRASPIKHSVVLLIAVLAFAPVAVFAQSAASAAPGADVEVRAVRFRQLPAPPGGQPWLEAAVELAVRGRTDAAGPYAGWIERVQVSLSFGIRKRAGDFDFYRSSAELVALDQGRAEVRFYLPPEIVRREQLSSEPAAVLVELAVRGRPVPAGTAAVSAMLRESPEALRSFKDRVAQAAPLNDGVLVPQYDSPFAASYGGDTPSFVRRQR